MKYPASAADFSDQVEYDLAVVSIGYERRSTHLLRRGLTAGKTLGIAFDQLHIHSFDSNLEIAEESGCDIRFAGGQEDAGHLLLEEAELFDGGAHLAIDISSMTRKRMASLLLALDQLAGTEIEKLVVDFFYSPAAYLDPPTEPVGTLRAGPLGPEFAGRLRRTSLPVGAVIGLGYEPLRALGAFELLEPTRTWAFRPISPDQRYSEALDAANEQICELIGLDSVLEYDLLSGVEMLYSLESFVFAVQSDYRLVLLPMGPKIFALACLLIGLDSGAERPAVWRVGEVDYHQPSDVIESGSVVGIRVDFCPPRLVDI